MNEFQVFSSGEHYLVDTILKPISGQILLPPMKIQLKDLPKKNPPRAYILWAFQLDAYLG